MLIILSIVSFSVAAMAGEPPTQLAVCRPSPTATVDDYMLWLGRSDVWGEDFADAADWTSIRGPDWLLNRWQTWVAIRPGRRLILSVPMLPSDLAGVSLEQGATGAYDVHYRTLAVNLVARGLGDTIVRLGWEFNGNWYAWAAKNKTAAFAAYWRRIVEAMRSVPGAQNLKFCWNPATGADEFPAEQAYPGDAYVDYVGLDVYDMSWAPNTYPWAAGASAAEIEGRRAAVWNVLVDGEHGIAFYQRFAAAHGKPFAFGEWGVAALPSGHGGGDNPRFVQNMHAYMATHPVAWATHFDVQMGASDHQLSPSTAGTDFPRARAKFLQCFGRGPLVSAFSSQQPGNEATKAIDGVESDDSNRWSGSSAGYPQWIELDLGSDLPIDRARVVGVSGRAYRFRVEARPSGGGYQTVLDRSANTQSGPIADTFATTTARYVRLVVTGAYNDTSGWVSIREFTVFEAAPAPVIHAVSSQQVGNEAWKAIDGIDDNDNNRWSPDRASYPQWLELDLA